MSLSYISKPKSIKSSSLREVRTSFCPKDYRVIQFKNTNRLKLSELIDDNFQGQEIGSEAYFKNSKYRFLKTVNITEKIILDETSIEYCIPIGTRKPKQENIFIVKDGAGNGLGEVCYYHIENTKGFDFISAGVLAINVKLKHRFYVLGILKSQHFKDFVNLNTPEGSTIRHSKKIALDYFVTFPTIKNNNKPTDIQNYLSLLVQNLIDKEKQFNSKNLLIDTLIEKELNNNQKADKYEFKYPTINEIRKEARTDTILYTDRYKRLEFLITNYKNGFFNIPETAIRPGKTPNDYFYTNYKADNTFEWVTPKNLSQRRQVFKTYLHTKQNPVTKKYSLIFSGIRYVGNCWFVEDEKSPIFCNQNTLVINFSEKVEEQLFILCFFSSQIGKKLQLMQRVFGIIPILYSKDFAKIPMPKFPLLIQKKIASEYYNIIPKDKKINLSNYLEKEKTRNSKLGIFQLNAEIIELKNKIELVVDKIIKEVKIDIKF